MFHKKKVMKQKQIKIASNTLFVYKSNKSLNAKASTDPTATMTNATLTGIFKR